MLMSQRPRIGGRGSSSGGDGVVASELSRRLVLAEAEAVKEATAAAATSWRLPGRLRGAVATI